MVAPPSPSLKKSTSAGSYLLVSNPVFVMSGAQVEQLVAEDVQAFDADRPDDVRRVAGGDLRREQAGGDVVVVDLERDVDLVLRLGRIVELLDEGLLGSELLGLTAGAEADEPADDDAAVGAGLVRGERDRRDGRRRGGGGAWPPRSPQPGWRRWWRTATCSPCRTRSPGWRRRRRRRSRRAGRIGFSSRSTPPCEILSRSLPRNEAESGVGSDPGGPEHAGRRPAQGMRLPALEARRMSSVARITRRGTGSEPSTRSMSRRAVSWPISSIGWRTLVSCGRTVVATGESS